MKREKLTYQLWAKVLAYLLLALSALALSGGLAVIIGAWEVNAYTADEDALRETMYRDITRSAGNNLLMWVLEGDIGLAEQQTALKNAEYRITDHAGAELWRSAGFDAAEEEAGAEAFSYRFACRKVTVYETADPRWAVTESDLYPTVTPPPSPVETGGPEPEGGPEDEAREALPTALPPVTTYFYIDYLRSYDLEPEALTEEDYVVEARVGALERQDEFYWTGLAVHLLWTLRFAAYGIALASLVLCILCFVFLLCGAGHRAGREELVPGYFYRVPFDLMTAVLAGAGVGMAALGVVAGYAFSNNPAGAVLLCLVLGVAGLELFTGWCASLAMRVKLGRWWENTLVYRVLRLAWKLCKGLWHVAGRVLRGIRDAVAEAGRNLPLLWRTALGLVLALMAEFILLLLTRFEWDNLMVCWLLTRCLLLVPAALWLALTLRRLQKGGEALAAGDLDYHTDTRGMLWDFKKHGEALNSIGAAMARAVEEQLRSERLKTELITNVSHDIKTPLTSIINYVDLLKRNDDPERAGEYLEVLDRQSHRLKKLTEDLVEVSKASTGNLEMNAARHSLCELLRQVSGEYAERMEAAGLTPVLTLPEEELYAWVDGTLLWRVLDNLCSNACKYAQPGTRFYISLREDAGCALMQFKNISREPLNLPAEELMERFVRGDAARGGEGSGLGLNIAQSLAQLQGGSLELGVDGDLFKAELRFPLC